MCASSGAWTGSGQIILPMHCQKLCAFTGESDPCEWQIDSGALARCAQLACITHAPVAHARELSEGPDWAEHFAIPERAQSGGLDACCCGWS